jgi:YVTN family beta-propeller protein
VVVTADWLNKSLTVLDYDALVDGQSDPSAAIVRSIDLSAWEPGPVELELTPDGKTAVVAVGPAFFDGLPGLVGVPELPPGGTLLIVDLDSGSADEIETEDVPMGIAISPDGTTAYTANYGVSGARGDTVSIIDIPGRRLLDEVNVGSGPEQIALSADGTLGIVNLASEGGVRVFQTSDVAGTLSELVQTGNDPSDLTFLAGNDYAVVANTQSFNLTLIDTSDPSAPRALESSQIGVGLAYGVSYVAARDEILATSASTSPNFPTNLVRFTRDGESLSGSAPLELAGRNFPLTAAADSKGDFAFVAHIVDHALSIVELESGEVRAIEWLSEPGPSYVAVQP